MDKRSASKPRTPNSGPAAAAIAEVRSLLRTARKGALGTLDAASGHPYVSLVALATEPGGAPVLLLSGLARHTRNLRADPRVSLLVDGSGPSGDPLAGGRTTLFGRAHAVDEAEILAVIRRRYLARHPDAAGYASFADFAFWRLEVACAHSIGGFGRIVEIAAADLIEPWRPSDPLVAAENTLVAELPPGLAMDLAPRSGQAAASEEDWRIVGIDETGLDLVGRTQACRRVFAARAKNKAALHKMISQLQNN